MLQKTRGIVFHQLKYSETSIIAKIYTEAFGLQSYMIRGARKKNASIRTAHLQHLALLEVEVNQRDSKSLQHLRNLKVIHPFKSIPFNIAKSSQAMFINEVLYKVVKEEETNPALFNFLFNSIQFLDLTEEAASLFHHVFLIQLSRYLGFYPLNNYSELNRNFNLEEGKFTSSTGPSKLFAEPPLSKALMEILSLSFEDLGTINLKHHSRNELLDLILNYYLLHIPGIIEFKSHVVLKEVFGG
ncbi:MAG: DNA repair protein RecO [Bacteroidales bacterium]|nr:DNA repair protein RecO [Bacteroidales bacterium]MCF8403666.1 DNA repair protein RecO [Bacteroidales bacterium]